MIRIILVFIVALLSLGCSGVKQDNEADEVIRQLRSELDSLKNTIADGEISLNGHIATFFTFQQGDAEEAMNFYMSLFEDTQLVDVKRWGKEGPGKEGSIMHASFTLNGKLYMCSDSPPIHDWDFTPAVSNYVECKDESELETLFTKLSQDGQVMMPLNNYGFSQKFGFVEDRFGISWQLNLQ